MVLKKKTNASPPDPTKPPIWFSWWVENEFKSEINRLDQKIDEVKQYVNDQISNLVKKNNLKE